MPLVADIPITQQYKGHIKSNIELVLLTQQIKNVEDLDFDRGFISFSYYDSLKKLNPIKKKVNEMTFLGSWDESEDEDKLTSKDVKSMSLLIGSYKKEVQRIKDNNHMVLDSVVKTFSYVSRKLYKLPIQNCAVEINSNETMKFTLLFSNDRLVMLTKKINIDGDVTSKDQIMYSFFINRKLIASDVTNLKVFTKNFKEYVSI